MIAKSVCQIYLYQRGDLKYFYNCNSDLRFVWLITSEYCTVKDKTRSQLKSQNGLHNRNSVIGEQYEANLRSIRLSR